MADIYPYNPQDQITDSVALGYGLLTDRDISLLCHQKQMIYPFSGELVKQIDGRKILSKGLSSVGYDVSLTDHVQIFTNTNGEVLDPKNVSPQTMITAKVCELENGDRFVLIPPNSYMLGVTQEYFKIPTDVVALCVGKSTMARIGAIVNVTPIEPGFEGNVVIEIANTTTLPMRVYVNEGIGQFLFFRSEKPCAVSYAARSGKYQGQVGLTMAKV